MPWIHSSNVYFHTVAAMESILSDLVGEAATSSQSAMEALKNAADATVKHAQTLKLAMDDQVEVI